jgi:hypothetical protein
MTNFLEVSEIKLTSQYQVVFNAIDNKAQIHPDDKVGRSLARKHDQEEISLILNFNPLEIYLFKVDARNLSLIPKSQNAVDLVRNNDYGGERRSKATPTTLLEVKLSSTQCQYCPIEGYLNPFIGL